MTKLVGLTVALAALSVAGTVCAATYTNSASGPWVAATNWVPAGGPPGAADIARLGDGPYNGLTVTIGPGETAEYQTLRLGAANGRSGAIDMTGGQLNAYGIGYFGNNGQGTVTQSGGAFNGGGFNQWIGANANGVGDYQVTGGSFTNMDLLHVGRSGNGTLTLSAPGVVQGKPNANVFIGRYAGSTGLIDVTAGSWDNNGRDFQVGREGRGTLRLAGGTLSNVLTLSAGYTNGGVGTIELEAGGRFSAPTNATRIGYWNGGVGQLVQTGGDFDGGGREIQIAAEPGSSGTYRLSAGSLTNFQALFVGRRGAGTFELSGTGLIKGNQPYGFHVGRFNGATGLMTQTGGTLDNNAKAVTVANEAGTMGTYRMSGGSLTNYNELNVGYNGYGMFELGGIGVVGPPTQYATQIGRNAGATGVVTQTGGILDGGLKAVNLGYNAGSDGSYNLNGGVLRNFLSLSVGRNGKGAFGLGAGGMAGPAGDPTYVGNQVTATGVVTQTGGTFDGGNKSLYVGNKGRGTWNISGGVVTNVWDLMVGHQAGASGTVALSGTGKVCDMANLVRIGNNAGATGLVVQTGGTWDNNGRRLDIGSVTNAAGTYRISGGSLTNLGALVMGVNGDGTLELTGAGTIGPLGGNVFVGRYVDSTGLVTQTGGTLDLGTNDLFIGTVTNTAGTYRYSGGTIVNVDEINVGRNGNGVFELSGAAVVPPAAVHVHVGRYAAGTGLVTQTGGTWNNGPKEFRIGNAGKGTWDLTGGAVTNDTNVFIAYDAAGTGTISIGGTGALQVGGEALVVGRAGRGALALDAGGTVILAEAAANTKIGHLNGSTGLVTMTGGTWDNGNNDLHLGYNAEASGTLEISGGTLTNVANLYNGYSNSSTNTVKITGSTATVSVKNYRQKPSSTLCVAPDSGGLTAIACANNLWLDGGLTVDFSNHDPQTTTLPLISYTGSLNGGARAFTSTNIVTAGWSAEVEIDTVGKTVSLVDITPPPASPGTVLVVR